MKIRVVSFNIRSMDDPDGYSIEERAPRLKKIVDDIDPDIIGLQEYRPQWEEYIERDFLDKYEMFNKYRATEGWIEGSPILWRKGQFDLLDTGYFWYSDTPDVESECWDTWGHKRMCIYCVFKDIASGKRFIYMNTHLGFGDTEQENSAKLLVKIAKALNMMLPLFITGDFNAGPESGAYRIMTESFKDVNALTENDWSETYHGYYFEGEEPRHIDYFFIDGNFVPLSYRVIRETVDGKYPTDHYGLEIELELR